MIDQRVRGMAHPAPFVYQSHRANRPYGPPPAGVPQGPSWAPRPPVPPRTRVTGIVVSWVVFVVLGLVALSGFLGTSAVRTSEAKPTMTFVSGQVLTVSLDPAERPAVYVAAAGPARVACAIADRGRLESLENGASVTDRGTRWEPGFRIAVPEPGTYSLRCTGDETLRFGVGKELAGDVVVWMVLLFVLPGLGLVGAVFTTAVVISKRRADRFEEHAARYA